MAGIKPAIEDAAFGGCCPAGAAAHPELPEAPVEAVSDAGVYARQTADGQMSLALIVSNMRCAACISPIEEAVKKLPGVTRARVNFSTRRLVVEWDGGPETAEEVIKALAARGYKAAPFVAADSGEGGDEESRRLMRALGVAGFAAANIMLLSVSVWAGAASDMSPGTVALFHWISALIALPAIAYAGQPFFRGAMAALRGRRLNMDVPISLAVVLAAAMSLAQTVSRGDAVYFDASVTLLFFLLIGRVLDHQMRAKARSAAENMLALRTRAATRVAADGSHHFIRTEDIRPGMAVFVAAGERVPADGKLASAAAVLDSSLITGESLPENLARGAPVYAGALNVGPPLEITVTAADQDSLLAEIVRLMEIAEQGRARYVRLADRVARAYAPIVHILGAVTIAVWLMLGAGWEAALLNGIAVLIITCPCALGLAVPAVQVVAGGRLLKAGVLVKSGDALERLARVDTVVFDKTGTLTTGELELVKDETYSSEILALAGALARGSRHPLSRALSRAVAGKNLSLPELLGLVEVPGAGLKARLPEGEVRLGNRAWILDGGTEIAPDERDSRAEIWLSSPGRTPVRFAFEDRLRGDAAETIARLKSLGLEVALLSGDRVEAVAAVAGELGIAEWRGGCQPQDKIARLEDLAGHGHKVMMVGDGLNDAPALATAYVSLSPAGAADIAQTAADFITLGDRLGPVGEALVVARASQSLVYQNFGLAFAYNVLAVPLAMAGLVTPLIAAVAMSASSIVVTLNALRLRWIS